MRQLFGKARWMAAVAAVVVAQLAFASPARAQAPATESTIERIIGTPDLFFEVDAGAAEATSERKCSGDPGSCLEQPSSHEAPAPVEFDLVTYNIKMPGFKKNRKRAAQMIPKLGGDKNDRQDNFDVIVMQEAYKAPPRKILLRGRAKPFKGRKGGLLNAYKYRDHAYKNGTLVISNWPIVDRKWKKFDENPGGRARGVLYTEIDTDATTSNFHVFSTHLWWDKRWSGKIRDIVPDKILVNNCKGYEKDESVRVEQLKEIDDFIASRNIPDGEPVFIAGDFNFGGPGDSRYQKCRQKVSVKSYRELKSYLNAEQLTHVAAEDHSEEWPGTTNGTRSLDHVFHRNASDLDRDASYIERRYFTTGLNLGKSFRRDGRTHLSDHDPVVAHYVFNSLPIRRRLFHKQRVLSQCHDIGGAPRPAQLKMNQTHEGTLQSVGNRMWVTAEPMTHNVLDLRIEKVGLRGRAQVTVCTHLPGGEHHRNWNVDIGRGSGNIGNVWRKKIHDVAGRFVSVFLNGSGALTGLKYTLRAEPRNEPRPAQQAGAGDSEGWSSGYTTAEYFDVGGQTYLLTLKASDGTVYVNQVNDDGTVGSRALHDDWSDGYSTAETFEVNGQTYLFTLKASDGTVYVNEMNADGTVGSEAFSGQWTSGWTTAEFYQVNGETYLFLLKESDGEVHIQEMNADGTVGSRVQTASWTSGWTTAETFEIDGKPFLFLLKESDGEVHIQEMNSDGTVGSRVETANWTSGWTTADFYQVKGKTYLFLLKESDGEVHIQEMTQGGAVGPRVQTENWTSGWTTASFFEVDGRPYLLLLKESDGEVHIHEMNDDGTVGPQVAHHG